MFAVIQVGSSQFKVEEGDVIEADRMDVDSGKEVKLDQVLLFAKGNDVRVGQPFLKDVKVSAKVVDHSLADKVTAFKFRRRKSSATKHGHRQKMTSLNITKISA